VNTFDLVEFPLPDIVVGYGFVDSASRSQKRRAGGVEKAALKQ